MQFGDDHNYLLGAYIRAVFLPMAYANIHGCDVVLLEKWMERLEDTSHHAWY